ncbi:MAG: SAM-dependent methyltransferase [Polyangiaceae bacterium]|nr:SAM-dependent methyltransferase [Polyangiaceae bacterium]
MRMPEMAVEAMEALSTSVRCLRTILEADLHQQLERRFRLSVAADHAGLEHRDLVLRLRFEAWGAERARARGRGQQTQSASCSAESEIASTALLRLFLLRQLEACGISRPPVLSGGWTSRGYLEFREHAPTLAGVHGRDDYEGLDFLLSLVFAELAIDLPGLYGETPLERYFLLSAAALRQVIGILNAPELDSVWHDDTSLGWVYQFWNDPRREAIDERVGPRGRVEPHEIASKTQLFTEQYMVEWLLQNSLGRMALAMRRARSTSDTRSPAQPPSGWPMFVADAVTASAESLPASLADLRLLDPACGSGHFLAGAFDLLVPLYREEARDRGVEVCNGAIVDAILRHNLHGVDIDSRAVQITAAVLYLKARRLAPNGRIPPMNLVATEFDLDGLKDGDPALSALADAFPSDGPELADAVAELRHVGVRGSLMRFNSDRAAQPALLSEPASSLERFLASRTRANDLGVRFDGAQLAAGVRLRALLVEGRYDVVAFNPPYLATAKIELPAEVLAEAFGDNTDLFAAFVQRSIELCKPDGLIAFVALSNWMFLSSFQDTRERLLRGQILLLADVGKGAFRRASKLIQSAMVVASPTATQGGMSLAARVGSRDAITSHQTVDIARALAESSNYVPFDGAVFSRIQGAPILFWLEREFMERYAELQKIGEVARCEGGIATTNNDRFLRAVWEVSPEVASRAATGDRDAGLLPYIKGAEGREWIEPYRWLLRAEQASLELRVLLPNVRPQRDPDLGVAYTTIGNRFGTRMHGVRCVRDVSGASVFPLRASAEELVCALNRTVVRELASALNPTINFQLGDVRRLPFAPVAGTDTILSTLRASFSQHEWGNELSVDYRFVGRSSWSGAKRWAQTAVDRAEGEPLPEILLGEDEPELWHTISQCLGVCLGRLSSRGGFATHQESHVPDGILLLSPASQTLGHETCTPLRQAWTDLGERISPGADLSSYLRKFFFAQHRAMYEGRPIYLPLSSSKRTYVAYVCVHRFEPETLSVLVAEHLGPERRVLEGELVDLRDARREGRGKGATEKRFTEVQKLLEELNDFIAKVTEIAERGPPPADDKTTKREVDARYTMDLDDGVMVNSAALWPLLEPQWKEPKKWWKELANAQGKKDYDWSHLAARYFPTRVKKKCHEDPSLAVAHKCFWELHPAKAYAWELRLQDEIRQDFTIDEPGPDAARAKFLADHATAAAELVAKEAKRRARKSAKADEADEGEGPLLGQEEESDDA